MPRSNYEILDFSTHMPLRCEVKQLGYSAMHQHDYFEIDFLLSGRLSASIGEKVYSFGPEDIFTVDAHVPHELRGSGCVLICVQFEQSLFEKTIPSSCATAPSRGTAPPSPPCGGSSPGW